jgi:excisionase family DNA binding protein
VNLKTAARRLGVHYQTAYRWVRSGQLVAVKVGSGYEISDAAVERFQAQRAAVERAPEPMPSAPVAGYSPLTRERVLVTLDAMVDAVALDARAVTDRATRFVAEVLGDLASVHCRRIGADPVITCLAHRDPVHEVRANTVMRDRYTSNPMARGVMSRGETLFLPQVPQRNIRSHMRPEMHQYLLSSGCYSAIGTPVMGDGRPEGVLIVTRDLPGCPYSQEDVAFVEAVAARISLAFARVSSVSGAWEARRQAMYALASTRSEHQGEELSPTLLSDLLEWSSRDDSQAAIAVLDLDLRHLACTKSFAVLLGDDPANLIGDSLRTRPVYTTALRHALDRLSSDELDFVSVEVPLHEQDHGMIHAAIMRRPDATKWCVVVVAHVLPALAPLPGD